MRIPVLVTTLLVAFVAAAANAGPARWQPVALPRLDVTSGTIAPQSGTTLATQSAELRATERDGGRHARWARLSFRLIGPSTTIEPLGSGAIRQQIGLKLAAQDPCNLVYVMWRSQPDAAIAIYVKRNPGLDTSAECGNDGYTTIATIGVPAFATGTDHVLEARTRHAADGSLTVSVRTDGALLRRLTLPAALVAGFDGPVGLRSDNGSYRFRLAARVRTG